MYYQHVYYTNQNNYYSQTNYNRVNYNPNTPPHVVYPPGAGAQYGYRPPQNANMSSPNIYPNAYGNIQQIQPIKLDEAINKSSYSAINRDIILETVLDNFSDPKENLVFLNTLSNEKIFIIMKTLVTKLINKTYNIPIIIHLPLQYPNTPAYFYIHKRPRTGINKAYFEQEKIIDPNTFRINTDRICPFNPSRNNLDEIINEMKKRFVNSFPIYAEKQNANTQPIPPGPNNPDQRKMNQVIVESSKMTNKQAIEMLRKQTRDIVIKKYHEFNNKYKVRENRGELGTISNIVKLKSGNSGNGNQNPMNDSLNFLRNLKPKLTNIENGLKQEIEECGSKNKTALEKCEEVIKIKDDEDMRLLMMKKATEDYIAFLKKAYEKRLVSFHDVVDQIRELSRQMFSIDYLRTQRKKENYF